MTLPAAATHRRRAAATVRAAWGATMLIAPGLALPAADRPPTPGATLIIRVLGVRHLVQSALTWLWPTDRTIAAGAAVDAAHASTAMIAVALGIPAARAATASAATAVAWTALGVAELVPAAGRRCAAGRTCANAARSTVGTRR